MIKLEHVPEGLHDIMKYYGSPGSLDSKGHAHIDRKWYKENISYFELPFTLRQSWDQRIVKGFIAHNKVGPSMVDALEDVKEYGGLGFLKRYKLDQWGGVFNPRWKKGATEPSTHMFGIAIDYCPELGPYGEESRMPCFIVEAFERRGFINLWMHDGMHNQAAKGY